MMTTQEFLQIDLPAMTAAVLACISCALVGNFLVLRRQSMLGDAISHAILPGIVVGFLVTGTRAGLGVILGALAAAIVAGVLIEAVRRLGRLDGGAAMGVVFTVMFAGGVVLIEQGAARAAERNRRLWERFLIHYPTLVPGRANWGIDPIDQVLPRDLVLELESFPEALSP